MLFKLSFSGIDENVQNRLLLFSCITQKPDYRCRYLFLLHLNMSFTAKNLLRLNDLPGTEAKSTRIYDCNDSYQFKEVGT